MRVATAIIYKGNRREETGQLLPRADAIADGAGMAEMIAIYENPHGKPGTIKPIPPAWPRIVGFEVTATAGKFRVIVRDQGRI